MGTWIVDEGESSAPSLICAETSTQPRRPPTESITRMTIFVTTAYALAAVKIPAELNWIVSVLPDDRLNAVEVSEA